MLTKLYWNKTSIRMPTISANTKHTGDMHISSEVSTFTTRSVYHTHIHTLKNNNSIETEHTNPTWSTFDCSATYSYTMHANATLTTIKLQLYIDAHTRYTHISTRFTSTRATLVTQTMLIDHKLQHTNKNPTQSHALYNNTSHHHTQCTPHNNNLLQWTAWFYTSHCCQICKFFPATTSWLGWRGGCSLRSCCTH